jgi:hypothetical protein
VSKYFQLSREAEKWFSDVRQPYSTKFDLYYLCLMAGLASGRKEEPADAGDLIEYYPREFKHVGLLLVGLLINAELRASGIDLSERDAVYRVIGELVDSGSQSNLKDEGVKAMNKYAQGGFAALEEYFDDRPRAVETFVRKYSKCLEDLQKEQSPSP